MVCIPCIVVPFLLWFFHKYIQPYIQKFWPWSKQQNVEDIKADKKVHCNGVSNGSIPNGQVVTAGDDGGGGLSDKKND